MANRHKYENIINEKGYFLQDLLDNSSFWDIGKNLLSSIN